MMTEVEVVVIDKAETVLESIMKDTLTFTCLAVCILLSYRLSLIWTGLAALMFVAWVFAKAMAESNTKRFTSYREAAECLADISRIKGESDE